MLAVASRHYRCADSELALAPVDLHLSLIVHQRKIASPSENRHPARGKTKALQNPVKRIGQKNATISPPTGVDSLTDLFVRQ